MSGYVVRWNDHHHDGCGTPCTVKHETVLVPEYLGDRPDRCAFASASLAEVMQVNGQLGSMGQALFSVSDDGTETPLPTYEEALAALAELRAKAATLRETADACEDARSLYDAIVDFCAEVSK